MYIDKQMSSRRLHIDLQNNDLYTLGNLSATGKSYLASLLPSLDKAYVVNYNKSSDVLNAEIEEALSGKYELVLFDRCDIYMTLALYKRCLKCAKHMVILLDLKNFFAYSKIVPRPAQIILSEEVLSVI